jgi:hypothetical protein
MSVVPPILRLLTVTARVTSLILRITPRRRPIPREGMAFLPISHMPFLSLTSTHLPRSSAIRSPPDPPAKTGRASTMRGRQLYLRYLHLQPASQITQRMPQPCFLYTSTRRRAKSPLRTMVTQDRSETKQPYARTRRRIQGPNESFARDALSDATRSHSRVILLPSRRTRVAGSQYNDTTKSTALRPQVSPVRAVGSTRRAHESARGP